jgi:cytochrome P450 family 142 subfamily A polypeptide 1
MKTEPVDVNVEYVAAKSWGPEMKERLAWLRENDPVHWSDKDQLWIITKFEDVAAISKNQEVFTSGQGVRPHETKIGLIDEEEPRHGQLRGLINRGFTPRMVKKLETVFRQITTDAIDAIADKGECDFVEAISVPLPLRLIAAMIGIQPEDYDRFHHWSDAMIAADGNMDDPEIMAKAGAAYVEYATYITEVIEDRRRNPQDDLVSILTGAKDEGLLKQYEEHQRSPAVEAAIGERTEEHMELANDELIKLLVILMVAGNETTRNGISGGMQLLIENPDQRQKLMDDPSLLNSAVEEMVRLVSPVHSFSRTVLSDTEVRGQKIEKGQRVLLVYPSANRDGEVFDDPDDFQIDRNPHHLGFGLGNHFCMGANLARMEMRVAFEEVLRRLPDIEYADDEGAVLTPSALVRTCARMKVRFTPEEKA